MKKFSYVPGTKIWDWDLESHRVIFSGFNQWVPNLDPFAVIVSNLLIDYETVPK